MAIGDGQAWDEANPQQSTLANTIDSYERDIRIGVRSRMQQEHVWPAVQAGVAAAGYHTYITFAAQAAPPSLPVPTGTATQVGALFVTAGALAFENSAGGVATIVSSGKTSLNLNGGLYSSTGLLGDIIIGTVGGNVQALGVGSSGQILTASTAGVGLVWSSNAAILNTITNNGSTVLPAALKMYMGTAAMAGGTSNVTVSFSDGNYLVNVTRLGTYHTEAVCIIGKSSGGFTLRDDNVGNNTVMYFAVGT